LIVIVCAVPKLMYEIMQVFRLVHSVEKISTAIM